MNCEIVELAVLFRDMSASIVTSQFVLHFDIDSRAFANPL
jgi:hypothetical protein